MIINTFTFMHKQTFISFCHSLYVGKIVSLSIFRENTVAVFQCCSINVTRGRLSSRNVIKYQKSSCKTYLNSKGLYIYIFTGPIFMGNCKSLPLYYSFFLFLCKNHTLLKILEYSYSRELLMI